MGVRISSSAQKAIIQIAFFRFQFFGIYTLRVPLRQTVMTIDLEEVDGVIKSLDFYEGEIKKGKPRHLSNVALLRCLLEVGQLFYIKDLSI